MLPNKYTLSFLCILLGFSASLAQQIAGTVIDNATGDPLPFANVFIDNTTIGSTTDADGKYRITGVGAGRMIVVASFVGYVTKQLSVELAEGQSLQLNFFLDEQKNQLSEVELLSKRDKKWERQLKRFEQDFIGYKHDPLVGKTKIVNPWVIDFHEGKTETGKGYFEATASEPIEIENSALGYQLIYHLISYRQTRSGTTFHGPVRFVEMDTTEKKVMEKWLENRQKAYLGSVRHFFKSMIRDNLASEG